jgi:hypothetical protein
MRMINGESRSETIDSVTQLVESCVKQHGIAPDERTRIANEFKNVLRGVKNLSITYKDDSTACVGLELIREIIEEYIDLYADKDPDYNNAVIYDGTVDADEVDMVVEEEEES